MNNDWNKIESGIFLFNKLHEYVSDDTMTHFNPIIARLINLLNHPKMEIKFPALVTLTTYTRHCIHLQPSQFFLPYLDNLLPFIHDQDRSLQKRGCLAILELHKFFDQLLRSYTHLLDQHVRKAYVQNESNSPTLDRVLSLVDDYILNL